MAEGYEKKSNEVWVGSRFFMYVQKTLTVSALGVRHHYGSVIDIWEVGFL